MALFSIRRHAAVKAAAGLVLCAGLVGSTSSAVAAKPNPELKRVKAATARFHSVKQAQKAGYLATPVCVSSPLGGMGYHFQNPALMDDGVLDPERPEILLYERAANGRYKLTGVEYYIPASQTAAAPVLFGQTFLGPMPAHDPGMQTHYDLHVWLWKHNPSGMFALWNPDVSCP